MGKWIHRVLPNGMCACGSKTEFQSWRGTRRCIVAARKYNNHKSTYKPVLVPKKVRGVQHPRKPYQDKYNHEQRFRKYGITEQDYLDLLELQDGKCAICLRVLDKPNIDHDPKTGDVRGLLCFNCNTALGHFGDSLQGIQRVVAYLLAAREAAEAQRRDENSGA